MSVYSCVTSAGRALLSRVAAGEGTLSFTRAEVGSGRCESEAACKAREALVERRGQSTDLSVRREGERTCVSFRYENIGVEEAFGLSEYGVFAADPDGGADILYCYVCWDEAGAERVYPAAEGKLVRGYETAIYVSDVKAVEIRYTPSGLVSEESFEAAVSGLKNQIERQNDALGRAIREGDSALSDAIGSVAANVQEAARRDELSRAVSELESRLTDADSALSQADSQLRSEMREADEALKAMVEAVQSAVAGSVDEAFVNAAVQKGVTSAQTAMQSALNAARNQLQEQISERPTDAQVQAMIAAARHLHIEHVDSLEEVELPDATAIYLVPHEHTVPPSEGADIYDEYMWINEAWEKIGSTDIDLSAYIRAEDLTPMTVGELDAALKEIV